MGRQTQATRACGKAKKEIKMLSCVTVIIKASVSKRLLIILVSLYIFTECLSFQHSLDNKNPIYKFEKYLRSDLRSLKQSNPYFYHYVFANVTFKRSVVKRVDGKKVYKLVHSKVPDLFVKYDCFSSICIDGGTVLISSWPPKFSQKTNFGTDFISLLFLEMLSANGSTNKLKKYLPVAVRLQSPLKKKHGTIEWEIVSTKDRVFMNCSGFETFHSRPISCKYSLTIPTRKLELKPKQKQQAPLLDDKRGHAHKRKYSLQVAETKTFSSAAEETNPPKPYSHVQFFRPLEIRLICPPFSGAIAENNKCICPHGKVNIMEKCVSFKKANTDGYSQSSFKSQISPIVPTKVTMDMDDSHPQDFVTIYVCPDYSRASLDDNKCVCTNGQIMKKRVCSPNQEESSIKRQENIRSKSKTSSLQQHANKFVEINKSKTRERKGKNLMKRKHSL